MSFLAIIDQPIMENPPLSVSGQLLKRLTQYSVALQVSFFSMPASRTAQLPGGAVLCLTPGQETHSYIEK